MELWTALTLGLVGSLHCGIMCGPLMLALPASGVGRLIYNAGRLTTYVAMGLVLGSVSASFALAGIQRWVSLGLGLVILLGLLFSSKIGVRSPSWKIVGLLKAKF